MEYILNIRKHEMKKRTAVCIHFFFSLLSGFKIEIFELHKDFISVAITFLKHCVTMNLH